MKITSLNVQNEGSSTSSPPFFDYNDYTYWKVMIIIYLQSIDYDLSLFIENRPHKPTKIKNNITVLNLEASITMVIRSCYLYMPKLWILYIVHLV